MGEKIDVPPLRAEKGEVGDRRLAARQYDKIADRQRLSGGDEHEEHGGLHPQWVEIVEIGDAGEHRHGDRDVAFRARPQGGQAERVLRRQARRFG